MFLPSPPPPGGKKWPLSNQEIITPLIFFRQKRNHVVWPEIELAFIKERTTYNGAIPSYDLIKTIALIARRLHALNKTLFIPRIDLCSSVYRMKIFPCGFATPFEMICLIFTTRVMCWPTSTYVAIKVNIKTAGIDDTHTFHYYLTLLSSTLYTKPALNLFHEFSREWPLLLIYYTTS